MEEILQLSCNNSSINRSEGIWHLGRLRAVEGCKPAPLREKHLLFPAEKGVLQISTNVKVDFLRRTVTLKPVEGR